MNQPCIRALPCALAAVLSGCSGLVKDPPQTLYVPPLPAAASAPLPRAKPQQPAARVIKVLPPHLDPDSELYQHRSVFFAFDDSAIRPEDRAIVESHGIYLWRYPELRIRVEGNTDDRGGREYNLALGERRAQAVKAAMRLLGARDEQIETMSYGEEKPRASGMDEDARARNRRADIVYRKSVR
jgi:peptidoglycan-associated lipoprotein